MEIIKINKEHLEFVEKYAHYQDLGGYSNLASNDLNKASRYDFQLTGLLGELAFYLYRYGSYDKLRELLDHKYATLRPAGKGDDGFDDQVTHNGTTRFIDIKSSHVVNADKIPRLNLIVPERELHQKMIYIAAFTIGETRNTVDEVALVGWAANEDIIKKWFYDPKKYCVPVFNLRNLSSLKKIL
jgi:hypothetical protein